MTAHGGTNPNASCSRLVSRMVISSALAPARLSLAPCSPPSRTLRAASRWPAAILDRSCAQRLRELRPGRRNGSQPNRETPDQPRDWLSLPTPNSEEALKSTHDLNAYDFYLRGMAFFYQMTKESLRTAMELFSKAIECDPNYAAALAMMAECISEQKAHGWIT